MSNQQNDGIFCECKLSREFVFDSLFALVEVEEGGEGEEVGEEANDAHEARH